ncbi:MAG: putative ABC transporter permease subunit [Gemmatimonadaceae bacterium]
MPSTGPSFVHLLYPKWQSMRARAVKTNSGALGRGVALGVVGLAFWAFIFAVLYRLLVYFRGIPEIGPLLAGKLLGLVLISFFGMLLLSNVISSLSTFFLARDLDLLVAGPVDWLRLYIAKLIETCAHSSWMVLLMAVPMFAAYGIVYDGGPMFALVVLSVFLPFLLLPTVVGSAITLLLVNLFPARRTKDILSVIAVLAAGGVVLLFRLMRPEQLARPEGFRSLIEFISVLKGPTSPWLPSDWVQGALMTWLRQEPDPFPLYLLWSTAAAFVVIGALLHRAMYAKAFTKAQESGERLARKSVVSSVFHRLLAPLGMVRRELVMKEVRLFFRDTTQWSQLILLAVLVVVYVFNIKFLPISGEGVTFFVANLIPFLNLVLAGFVLASIAARFIFPGVSLEGRTMWLLRSSPLSMRDLLWAKFWVGTIPLLFFAVGLVLVTGMLMKVSTFIMLVSVLTITMMTFAISGMAIGFGTLFPRFETENAAQIPTSFGGLLFMMASIVMIGVVITLEARPVFSYLASVSFGSPRDPGEMYWGFGVSILVCLFATLAPIRMALRRLDHLEV